MPTPSEGYRTKDGKRVPGTTTITGRFKDSGGLIRWANNIAREPLMQARHLLQHVQQIQPSPLGGEDGAAIDLFLAIDPDLWDNAKASQKAADAGTCAHDMFDCWIRRVDFTSSLYSADTLKKAEPAYLAAYEWAKQSKFKIIETEVRLVSEKYRFGGTRDAVLVGGKRAIGDWKTSNTIYPEMLCQLAAYGILDEEATGNPLDGGYHLLRFSKQEKPTDPVHFVHHHWSHLDEAKEAFLMMRRLYDIMANLGRLAK